ncbi:hypothetical protein HKD37_19G052788 [Glycine soja]
MASTPSNLNSKQYHPEFSATTTGQYPTSAAKKFTLPLESLKTLPATAFFMSLLIAPSVFNLK